MLVLTQLSGFGGRHAAPPPFSYSVTDTSAAAVGDATSFNFTSQSFGAVAGEGETRYIAVAVAAVESANRTINSVTIGGVAATNIVQRTATTTPCGVWVAAVPTGTTGTVALSFNGSIENAGILVARLINPGNHLGFDTASANHVSGTIDLSLDIPSGGFAIAAAHTANGSSTTWTGLTEQIDIDTGSGEVFTAASGGSPGTPTTITADNANNAPGGFSGVACSWGP